MKYAWQSVIFFFVHFSYRTYLKATIRPFEITGRKQPSKYSLWHLQGLMKQVAEAAELSKLGCLGSLAPEIARRMIINTLEWVKGWISHKSFRVFSKGNGWSGLSSIRGRCVLHAGLATEGPFLRAWDLHKDLYSGQEVLLGGLDKQGLWTLGILRSSDRNSPGFNHPRWGAALPECLRVSDSVQTYKNTSLDPHKNLEMPIPL